jgi:ribonuclease J
MMSRDGIVVAIVALNKETGKLVGLPDIVSRGFIDSGEFKDLLEKSSHTLAKELDNIEENTEDSINNDKVREVLKNFFYERTHRHPMIIPVIVKV